jgi:D-glycero-beta-D-manno-heptose 1-phosphate adenylyltransferase
VKTANQQKKKIVFVSGVFDVLHYGHVDFLMRAKALVGDEGELVVAIHDDESVAKHKGAGRPINGLDERKKFLEAIRYVDRVVPWIGWENIKNLVLEMKPDYIAVSGDDYKNKNVGVIASQINAKLHIFPKIEGVSSSKIIERIKSIE